MKTNPRMKRFEIFLWFIPCVIFVNVNIFSNVIVQGSSHDLFASLFELEMIWANELEVIEVMERVVRKWKDVPNEFKL